jgi:hypothetical protein
MKKAASQPPSPVHPKAFIANDDGGNRSPLQPGAAEQQYIRKGHKQALQEWRSERSWSWLLLLIPSLSQQSLRESESASCWFQFHEFDELRIIARFRLSAAPGASLREVSRATTTSFFVLRCLKSGSENECLAQAIARMTIESAPTSRATVRTGNRRDSIR